MKLGPNFDVAKAAGQVWLAAASPDSSYHAFLGAYSLTRRFYLPGRIAIPLLRPPDPQLPKRKFYVRIDEALAVTLDRYFEFLGTTSVDHVVNQALAFVFRKDGDLKEWLSQNSQPLPRPTLTQRKRTRSGQNSHPAQRGPQQPEREEAPTL